MIGSERRWGTTVVRSDDPSRPWFEYEPRPASMVEVGASLERWGGRVAVVDGDRRITYEALARMVDDRVRLLAERGVERSDPVLLLAANSVEWIVTFWAILGRGAVAVLGNGWWSAADVAAAVDLIDPRVVVADERGAALVPAVTPHIAWKEAADRSSAPAPAPAPAAVRDADPAIVIFTSGSSGLPRPVVLSHRAVVANIQSRCVRRGWTPDDVDLGRSGSARLLSTPLFHVGGLGDLLLTQVSGDRLVLTTGKFDPGQVLALIEAEGVRSWGAVPTMVARVLDHPDLTIAGLSSLSTIAMGGTAVPPELRARLEVALPHLRRRSGVTWGMTECGGSVTIGAGKELDDRPGSVGRPLATAEVRVDVADGGRGNLEGELLVRTPTMCSGFWGDPEPIVDPDGWLRTGDRGRIDEDGYVYVTGRIKDIVIRAGENVSAAAVEAWLNSQPEIASAAVVGLPHADLGEEVAARVSLRPGAAVATGSLRARADGALPSFAIPSRWWITGDPLPVNDVGKVDKRAIVQAWPEER